MTDLDELPKNIDLQWLDRQFMAIRQDLHDVKSNLRHIREDLNAVAIRVIRIDTAVTALRDDVRALWEGHSDLRHRIEDLEASRGA